MFRNNFEPEVRPDRSRLFPRGSFAGGRRRGGEGKHAERQNDAQNFLLLIKLRADLVFDGRFVRSVDLPENPSAYPRNCEVASWEWDNILQSVHDYLQWKRRRSIRTDAQDRGNITITLASKKPSSSKPTTESASEPG